MKSKFYGYQKKSEDKINQVWENCIFVYDTNVLLNLYRYSQATQMVFLGLLNQLKERSWIPYYVGHEFFKNRLEVIKDQENLYEKIERMFNFEKIKNEISHYNDRHFSINVDEIITILEETKEKLTDKLSASKARDVNYLNEDSVLDQIYEIFDDRVSEPLSDKDLEEIYKEGKIRYEKKIPPGYMDEKEKPGNEKYNDYIIWSMILNYSKLNNKPIIFVTDDRKEDWWQEYKGRTIGPRFELINEFYINSGLDCLIYKPQFFLKFASQKYNIPNDNNNVTNAVEEIIKVQEAKQEDKVNLLLRAALDTLEEGYSISVDDILNSIDEVDDEFSTVDVVRVLDNGDYIVGLPINKAVGRILSEIKNELNLESLGRTNIVDDHGNATTTQIWRKKFA